MRGDIVSGDADRFLITFAQWDVPPRIFHIDSKGGDLKEAMSIGRIVRESQIPLWTGENCLSACVFVYVAGVERNARGTIGLHRPYFDPSYYAGLNSTDAAEQYKGLSKDAREYLEAMGTSRTLIDKIFDTGSDKIDTFSAGEANEAFGKRAPFYDEWLAAKCGRYSPREQRIIDSLIALRAAGLGMHVLKDPKQKKSSEFADDFMAHVENAKLAMRMYRDATIQPYIKLQEKHSDCLERATNAHVFAYHQYARRLLGLEPQQENRQ